MNNTCNHAEGSQNPEKPPALTVGRKPNGKSQPAQSEWFHADRITDGHSPVSYTHLDVYKRQIRVKQHPDVLPIVVAEQNILVSLIGRSIFWE